MLDLVKKFFLKSATTATAEDNSKSKDGISMRIQVVTCALLLEVANSDDEFSDVEKENIVTILDDAEVLIRKEG